MKLDSYDLSEANEALSAVAEGRVLKALSGLQTRPNDGQPYSWEGRVGAPCS